MQHSDVIDAIMMRAEELEIGGEEMIRLSRTLRNIRDGGHSEYDKGQSMKYAAEELRKLAEELK